ncbi:hypothetical protein [Oceanobacillus alkalisoli]|uniref:hypothetical protein n=1 Tax=Oceanobacillus alkalisoli TaxID=2925113 RepID=UPI001F120525|nr:hypothetical protein [Oceanobacillus alkalisoli]MCF3943472.1 hypothetical protein [Oceanobacillus alkalisoli]
MIENIKNNIDDLFITSRQIIEQINSGERELSEGNVSLLIERMSSMSELFNSSFKNLRVEHQLNKTDLEEIYLNPNHYQGQAEIVEFIELLRREGFQIIESSFKHQSRFQIRPDYYSVVKGVDDWREFEGVAAYFSLIDDKFDVYYPGIDNMHAIPWYEFDDILLELETIYETYPESRNLIFRSMPFSRLFATKWYLNDYLARNATGNCGRIFKEN